MKNIDLKLTATVVLSLVLLSVGGSAAAAAQQAPTPSVPERMTLEGEFVRLAYNSEGYAVLGYRMANSSVGEEWMLLQLGLTVMPKAGSQSLSREALSLKTPDGKEIALATQRQFAGANRLPALNRRADVIRDSVNYFPIGASRPCRIGYFSDPSRPGASLSYNQVDLNSNRACVGRVFFHLPDGIDVGQYWLVINFANGPVEVPFKIMTKHEEKDFRKKWRELKKQHDDDTKHQG